MSNRYWFSPGPVPVDEQVKIEWSHRSPQFVGAYRAVILGLNQMIPGNTVLIQGSASAAIESVLDALELVHKNVIVVNTGAFAQRVVERLNRTGFPVLQVDSVTKAKDELMKLPGQYDAVYMVQFETSNSSFNDCDSLVEICNRFAVLSIVDAVSAFPYYTPPKADVVILSSSKQLRGLPVMGIVNFRSEVRKKFRSTGSYLDLVKAIEYAEDGQTPHTSLIPQVVSLGNSLKNRLWERCVSEIDYNCEALTEQLEDYIIGEREAPVLTFEVKNVSRVVAELMKDGLEVYYNPAYSGSRFQVSMFNYGVQLPYELLNEALLNMEDHVEGNLL